MGIRRRGALAWGLLLGAVFFLTGTAEARDYFLTVGGGYSPTGNQVSLEKNVQFFERLLDEHGLAAASNDVYFSDWHSTQRYLKF